MKRTVISVIIPVYNAQKTIVKCVESLIYGRYKDLEVILVDDCSKDGSWELCQRLTNEYENVFCYRNNKNSGVSFTRNHGLRKSNGEYILFVDSDDWVSGRYALLLLKYARQYPESLVICGAHFYNDVTGSKIDYLWQPGGDDVYFVKQEQFFELPKRLHMQQLWNKIFRRDIIEQFDIRFDETQNMGEDFSFVLDYMEAAKCKQCVILNEALYYYIRANNSSLMSNFGLSNFEKSIGRMEKLFLLCGSQSEEVKKQYYCAVRGLKNNIVYQIARSNASKKNKIENIELVMQDGKAMQYYCEQRRVQKRDKIVKWKNQVIVLFNRLNAKIIRKQQNVLIQRLRKKAKMSNQVTIISQNCIGGVFYHDMGMQFLSPTINLYFEQPDFVKFVNNLEHYINSQLVMHWEEEYPVGVLGGDIRIMFMHYNSCSEAKMSWEKRKHRINYGKVLVLCTDRNGFNDEVFEEWKRISYPKVLFTVQERYAKEPGTVVYHQYDSQGFVPDLIPKREFYKDNTLINVVNGLN